MAKIRHVAVYSRNPERLAGFYTQVLGLKEVARRADNIFLSDGYINMAILTISRQGNAQPGVNHMGFLVDDVEETRRKFLSLEEFKVEPDDIPRAPGQYFEEKFRDPEGFVFDISARGWDTCEETGGAKIRHIAILTRNLEKEARFYNQVLGLEEVARGSDRVVYLSDGYINLAIIRVSNQGNAQPGINHIGFLVKDTEEMRRKLLSLEGEFKVEADAIPRTASMYYEEKFRDPEGFLFDISASGWATSKATA